jgi:aryl-alcohol dehydrogenase-like predicted oxidoreductase
VKYRRLGQTGYNISEVGLGTWQAGGVWGSEFDRENAYRIINESIDRGVNFIDTADVYSDGLSEKAVGKVVRERTERVYVATKCGRKITPHVAGGYTVKALRGYVEDSLANTGIEAIDLIQLHCPPTEVYYMPEVFGLFDRLKDEGKILNLGVSVEKVEEAIKAIEYPNVTTVQIIFNMFRHRPKELFFRLASERDIGVIVRVPLASGLLSGALSRQSSFGEQDHRFFNRGGKYFDRGETFSGVDFETGLLAVEEIRALFPEGSSLALHAIRWPLMFPEVSTVIPGASKPEQAIANVAASDAEPLDASVMKRIEEIYDSRIKPLVHQYW